MEFLFMLFICPVLVVAASIMGFYVFKNWFVAPIITFLVFTILTFAVFNETFFFWVVVYTTLSIIISLIERFRRK